MRVVFVGEANVGKTCLINRHMSGQFTENEVPTIQPGGAAQAEVGGVTIKVWDTAGQERFRALNQAFFRDVVVACVCYYPLDPESESAVQMWMGLVQTQSGDAQMILVSTKQDLVAESPTTPKPIAHVGEACGIDVCMETSAKTGEGVEALFEQIGKMAASTAPAEPDNVVVIKKDDNKEERKKKCKC
jgi:small GTP-binding protein